MSEPPTRAICDGLMTGLLKSKLPMTAIERSPYCPARALKRELFGIQDAGNEH